MNKITNIISKANHRSSFPQSLKKKKSTKFIIRGHILVINVVIVTGQRILENDILTLSLR